VLFVVLRYLLTNFGHVR